MASKLKIIPLGGLGEIGKNLTVYEYGKDMFLVDCGMGFPDQDLYGVDMVIPDISYLKANKNRIRGMVITPIQGGMIDLPRLGQLGNEGVLALLSDSTNVERPGYCASEARVIDCFDELFKDCNKRIIVTTFASNVHRLQQIINVAAKYKRKVGITGRSMENVMRVATELGYVDIPDGVMMTQATVSSSRPRPFRATRSRSAASSMSCSRRARRSSMTATRRCTSPAMRARRS